VRSDREHDPARTVRYRHGEQSERDKAPVRTETAVASAPAAVTEPLGTMLGRYRIERELGAGAMGVVHAAFDPDLERRIALKVLRSATATSEARDRLLREARAMARLSHPNVVTVYEVGAEGARDFIAMELIHGNTLAQWLRETKRSPWEVLDTFLAAGQGLAAAHAAGIVHRDFKPHNVLRRYDGRIVVTDFGLAREAEAALPAERDVPRQLGADPGPSSSVASLTATGALLGTPPYMAPEQWRGDAVTPATDQFAYCVALWEALAGKRPYHGPTLEDLRNQIARGPAALDASHIPRRLRGLLLRGLDPDPERRWPSMNALLVRLVRARRRPRVAFAIAGAVATAIVLLLAVRPGDVPTLGCETPGRDLASVWSETIAADLRAKTSDAHVAVLAAAFRNWQTAHTAACAAPAQVRPTQLQCLGGVLGRFDALRQAFAQAPGIAAEEIQAQLIDPEICRKPATSEVPRLTLAPDRDVISAYALYGRSHTEHKPSDSEITSVIDAPTTDPCARVIATLAFEAESKDVPRVRSLMTSAVGAADQCGDDRLRAEVLIRSVRYEREWPVIGPKGEAALNRAQAAADRVMQPEIAAELAAQRLAVARQRGQWDEAFRLVDSEIAAYGARGLPARQLQAAITRNELRLARRDPSDLDAIAADVPAWRPLAVANHKAELAWQLDIQDASVQLHRGNTAAAHAELLRLWQDRPASDRPVDAHTIEGEVVDDHRRPVAGATVAAATHLFADSVGIGLPLPNNDDTLQITTTDAAGHFVLRDAAVVGAIAAQLGDRRSRPTAIADRVTLVLEPTRTVSGKVNLAAEPYTHVGINYELVDVPTSAFYAFAPVAQDGSFAISGVTLGAIRLGVVVRGRGGTGTRIQFHPIPASSRPVVGLELTIASSARTLDVIVRSSVAAPLEGAHVALLPGKQQIRNYGELLRMSPTGLQEFHPRPVVGDSLPAPVVDAIRPGDLFTHVEHVVPGVLTVCACSLPGNLMDPAVVQRLEARSAQLTLECKQVGPDAKVVVLDVPPQQRLD
jgi:predicted Ser/Thr protein kinase